MARTSTDLKQVILTQASKLFIEQGYAATSIKQIAQAANCTTASLYYYYQEGKPQILREVTQSYAQDLFAAFETSKGADTLEDFLQRLGQAVASIAPEIQRRISWLELEAPHLAQEVKRAIDQQAKVIHTNIAIEMTRFLRDKTKAAPIAWLIFCAYFGYEQLFFQLGGLEQNRPLSIAEFAHSLADIIEHEN